MERRVRMYILGFLSILFFGMMCVTYLRYISDKPDYSDISTATIPTPAASPTHIPDVVSLSTAFYAPVRNAGQSALPLN